MPEHQNRNFGPGTSGAPFVFFSLTQVAQLPCIGDARMNPSRVIRLAAGAALLVTSLVADEAIAQAQSQSEKLNAYVGCINRLSARAYDSRARYFSWVSKD